MSGLSPRPRHTITKGRRAPPAAYWAQAPLSVFGTLPNGAPLRPRGRWGEHCMHEREIGCTHGGRPVIVTRPLSSAGSRSVVRPSPRSRIRTCSTSPRWPGSRAHTGSLRPLRVLTWPEPRSRAKHRREAPNAPTACLKHRWDARTAVGCPQSTDDAQMPPRCAHAPVGDRRRLPS